MTERIRPDEVHTWRVPWNSLGNLRLELAELRFAFLVALANVAGLADLLDSFAHATPTVMLGHGNLCARFARVE